MNFLIDTNVISELKKGHKAAPHVTVWFTALLPENIFTSVIVLGEIRRGIELVARRDKPQAEIFEQWYLLVRQRLGDRVLLIDEGVMTIWAKISAPNMLPAYDGLIAATALAHDLVIATRNTRDFRRAGARVVNPWERRR